MGRRLRSVPRLALFPAAAGGLVAGHFLTYVFLAPAGSHRAILLAHTGHAYFPRAIAAAAAFGALAMGAVSARGVARRHASSAALSWRPLAARMVAIQAAGFVTLEIVERMIVHAPLGGLVAVLPTGFAMEALVAAAVAAFLCLTARVAEAVVRALTHRPRPARAPRSAPTSARSGDTHPALELLSSSVSVRGPPAPSIA